MIEALEVAFAHGDMTEDKFQGLEAEVKGDCFDRFTLRDLLKYVPKVFN